MRKNLSLFLAIVMLMSVLIIPAAAATVENEVDPCAVEVLCPVCDSTTDRYVAYETRTVTVNTCGRFDVTLTHTHTNTYQVTYVKCLNTRCGITTKQETILETDICNA